MPLSRSGFLRAVEVITESGLVTVQPSSPLLSSPPPPPNDSLTDINISRDDLPLPLIIVPTQPDKITLKDTIDWVSATQAELETLLGMTGAILFRGFPIPLASDFAEFVETFNGWSDLPYEDSLSYAVRLRVCKRVCTTNEGKRGGLIFHHELAQTPKFPSKLLFYCEQPATIGGATAITPSWIVLDELKKHYPSFVSNCKVKGVTYRSIFPADHDSSIGVGRSWKSFFGKDTKEEVKARMDELGYSGTWDDANCLHLDSPVLPAIRVTSDGTEVFFNQMIAQHLANAKEFSNTGAVQDGTSANFIRYGDGSAVDGATLEFAHQVSEKHAVEVKWQKGDILLIDNMLLMHARREFEGPRHVFASLVQ